MKERDMGDRKRELYKEIKMIEEKRDELSCKLKRVDVVLDDFDMVQRDVRAILCSVCEHCEDDMFVIGVEECEEELYNGARLDKMQFEKRQELLKEEIRRSYDREEELRNELYREITMMDECEE